MRVLFLSLAVLTSLFSGSVQNPTKIEIGVLYDYDLNTTSEINASNRYYTFTTKEIGNIFIVNPNPKNAHRYRIYDEDYNLVESDVVIDSKTESLYKGKYLYHNVKGAFSIHSKNLK